MKQGCWCKQAESRGVRVVFPSLFSHICFSTSCAVSLLVVGGDLCLLLASLHAHMPFVWRGLCWSCPHSLLWAAVLLSFWSLSACIITEQWTIDPGVSRRLRIWQNNYIVISLKTDAHFLWSGCLSHTEVHLASSDATNFRCFCVWEVEVGLEFDLKQHKRRCKLKVVQLGHKTFSVFHFDISWGAFLTLPLSAQLFFYASSSEAEP